MGKSLYALLKFISQTFSWLLDKFLEFLKSKVSFAAKIDELHQDNIRLARDISKWKDEAVMKSERRRIAEFETSQLKVIIQQLQMNNQKLEKHISEWKLIVEESKSSAVKYCRKMNKIFTALEKVKSKLSCIWTEEHLE